MYRSNNGDFSLVEGRILRHSSKQKKTTTTTIAITTKKKIMDQVNPGRKSHL